MCTSAFHTQKGLTLLEVMITVVILSIGLLGLAGLQVNALSFNNAAHQRSQATHLSSFIIDSMRANVAAAHASAYNITMVQIPTGAGLAIIDLQDWRQAIANSLPAGTSSIVQNPANINIFTITIQWDDSHGQEAPLQFMTMTQL